MSFLVIDSKNTSSVLVPAIRVCACENRGNCSEEATTMQTQDLLFNLYKLLSCDCNLGLTGQFCEEQRDFCQTEAGSPCHPQTTCMNSQTNFVCGGCPSGFSGDGLTCTGKVLISVLMGFDLGFELVIVFSFQQDFSPLGMIL